MSNEALTKKDLLEALETQEKRFEKKLSAIEKNMATKAELSAIEKNMATKADLAAIKNAMATKSDLADLKTELKSDLEKQTKVLKAYTDEVAQEIIKSVGEQNAEIIQSIDELRLNTVTREEFEALKRKVYRLTSAH